MGVQQQMSFEMAHCMIIFRVKYTMGAHFELSATDVVFGWMELTLVGGVSMAEVGIVGSPPAPCTMYIVFGRPCNDSARCSHRLMRRQVLFLLRFASYVIR